MGKDRLEWTHPLIQTVPVDETGSGLVNSYAETRDQDTGEDVHNDNLLPS